MSDPGCVRPNNEDCYLLAPAMGLYVVADGMGGAQAGEHASHMAVDTVKEIVAMSASRGPAVLQTAFAEANTRVSMAAEHDPELDGMGTTLIAVLDNTTELFVASVGDSRVYSFQDGALHTITEDQSWVNEVGRRLGLEETVLKTHPMRHVLTMAIGVSDQLRVQTYRVEPKPGMLVLLCSDGLHGVVPEENLAATMADGGTLEEKCRSLVAIAKEHGGPDNITAVLLKVV
ncbi:MAG TPA: protein phosphatase 2C domain-containing protein [Rhizomicrobium sp.]|nr:protein phosphatase 2C domain-containing protein [Rhizomicrobium sp.]